MTKEEVFCDNYLDGKLRNSMPQKRVVYTDKKGRYVQSEGRKYYLDEKNHFKWEAFTIKGAMSFKEMIADVKKKNEEAMKKHQTNGGMCQHCGKNKAEYPNGLNPFNCKQCNEEAGKLVKELSKDPSFMMFGVQ